MYGFSQYSHRVAYGKYLFIEWMIGPMVETQFFFGPYIQQYLLRTLYQYGQVQMPEKESRELGLQC